MMWEAGIVECPVYDGAMQKKERNNCIPSWCPYYLEHKLEVSNVDVKRVGKKCE